MPELFACSSILEAQVAVLAYISFSFLKTTNNLKVGPNLLLLWWSYSLAPPFKQVFSQQNFTYFLSCILILPLHNHNIEVFNFYEVHRSTPFSPVTSYSLHKTTCQLVSCNGNWLNAFLNHRSTKYCDVRECELNELYLFFLSQTKVGHAPGLKRVC